MSAATAVGLEALAFEPVSLDELVQQAALMKRVDRKYLLPVEVAAEALAGVDPRSRVLEIEGRRDFAYDSVYFDTADHLSYRLTAQKRRRRFKLRTRSYLDTGGCFLEVKTKSGRGATVKQRIDYDAADRAELNAGGRAYAREVLGPIGLEAGVIERLRPSLTSRYHRTTLLMPEGSRATIDTRLSWGSATGAVAPELRLPDYAILETKSSGASSELDRSLWRAGHRPLGISKFGTGTAALHPELPSNKWARVLHGAFASATH